MDMKIPKFKKNTSNFLYTYILDFLKTHLNMTMKQMLRRIFQNLSIKKSNTVKKH